MALSMLVACGEGGNNTDTSTNPPAGNDVLTNDSIVGEWVFEADLSDLSAEFAGMEGKIKGYFDFKEDGTASAYFKADEFFSSIKSLLLKIMTIEYIAQASGMSVQDLQNALSQMNTTW